MIGIEGIDYKKQFLVTTAISYPNAEPHIGHMYEVILADIIKNYHTILGHNTKLVTGTDEHGKKIQQTAEKQGLTPIQLCDRNVEHFKELVSSLQIEPFRFIRTTDPDHEALVRKTILKCVDFIEKEKYTGYYNVREESYVTEHEASETDYKDPVTGLPYEKKEEECFKFDLPKFKDVIIENLRKVNGFNTDSFDSKIEALQKLTISRLKTDFTWGIDFPLCSEHVVYVWFDALLNYITARNSIFKSIDPVDNRSEYGVSTISPRIMGILEEHSGHSIHVIGKDIVWFHSVIYPAILAAAEIKQYHEIYVHGFIVDSEGRKMSKSLGNVVSPKDLFSKYTVEQIRFYFFYETRTGEDLKYNEDRLIQLHNEVLVGKFFNLFQRVYKLISDINYPFHSFTDTDYDTLMYPFHLECLRVGIDKYLHECNELLSDRRPWNMTKEDKYKFFTGNFGRSFYNAVCVMACIIPEKVKEMNSRMGLKITSLPTASYNYDPTYKSFKKLERPERTG